MEHRLSGLHTVVIQGLKAGTLDLTHESVWGHDRGTRYRHKLILFLSFSFLLGYVRVIEIFNEKGANSVRWEKAQSDSAIVWYKVSC